jgi:hypothetical protein
MYIDETKSKTIKKTFRGNHLGGGPVVRAWDQ